MKEFLQMIALFFYKLIALLDNIVLDNVGTTYWNLILGGLCVSMIITVFWKGAKG